MTVKWFSAQLPASVPSEKNGEELTVFPRHNEELQSIIRLANMTRTKIGTRPAVDQICLDLRHINKLIRHRQEEFLVSAQAGITMGELESTIAEKNQRFPLVYSAHSTLGQVLNFNPPTLSLTKFLPLPHWVVGIEAFTGDGEYIHFGGEVVKNVTGYDMSKLFVGSQNQFGIIIGATLKLVAIPETRSHSLLYTESMEQAMQLASWIEKHFKTVELLAVFRTKTTFGWHVLVSFSGYRELVEEELPHLKAVIAPPLDKQLQDLEMSDKTLSQWFQKLDWTAPDQQDALVVRVVGESRFLNNMAQQIADSDSGRNAEIIIPSATHQMLLKWVPQYAPDQNELVKLHSMAQEWNGFLEVLSTPKNYALKQSYFDWQQSHTLDILKSRIKQQFDPHHVLPSLGNTELIGMA